MKRLRLQRETVSNLDSTKQFRIKEEFKFEKYLEMNDSRLTEAIAKVRLSSHLFYIERGRWKRPKVERENRLCDVCHE